MANEMYSTETEAEPYEGDETVSPGGYVPEGWQSAEDFIKHVREQFAIDAGYDRLNREHALEDLQFLAGDQWDDVVKADRESKGRPCMMINVLPQFVGQVMGDRRLNKTSIKVVAVRDATAKEAEVRAGLIKAIENNSRAERVYDAVCEDQVSCGISNFRIDLDYADNDVFEQDIFIRHIPNPLAVVWDCMSIDPTGRDARHCFVQDAIPRKVYEKEYPDHPCPSPLGDQQDEYGMAEGWFDKDVVRIAEFWELIRKPATFALMQNGDVADVTGKPEEDWMGNVALDPKTGQPKIRQGFRTYARMHLVTSFAILSEAYELPLSRLPIIKVEGRVVRVGEDRYRFGLVRFAKDSQRLKNYWRSVAAERLAMAPKAQWTATEDAVEGREDEWRQAHLTGDPLLIHNKGTEAPKRVDAPDVPAALLNEAAMNQQDIKDTTGLQDASLGIRSNEVSGRAIQARQREGDVATIIYHDNLNQSILEGGVVINELLPLSHDTMRRALIIGEDDKRETITLNDPNDPDGPDITEGKYDLFLVTGPSFTTQRMEAQDAMMTLIQTSPELMNYIGDLVAKNMDWPGAHEISERLKAMMQQAGTLPKDPEEDVSPEEQQAMQAQQMMQQAQMEEALAVMEHAKAMREAELAKTEAEVQQAQANVAEAEANVMTARAKAQQALSDAMKAEIEARMAPLEKQHKMSLAERSASAKAESIKNGAGNRPAGERARGNKAPQRQKKEQK